MSQPYGPVSDEKGERMFELEINEDGEGADRGAHPRRDRPQRGRGAAGRAAVRAARGPAGPDADEFYFDDLTGLDVATTDGEAVGVVVSVQDFGTGPLLEVGQDRGATILVPFTREIVPVVDLAAGRIEIDPPVGLLEPVEKEPVGKDGEADHDD